MWAVAAVKDGTDMRSKKNFENADFLFGLSIKHLRRESCFHEVYLQVRLLEYSLVRVITVREAARPLPCVQRGHLRGNGCPDVFAHARQQPGLAPEHLADGREARVAGLTAGTQTDN